ncbi:hypothetical protein MNBD_GAMMA16-1988 [hydrothermal vent metagenome]|uniref:J domain-containing protein n=1 Tax=hydrothermal vent metagenome TaxID=652676 RepID=A0A3B0Z7K3_9ZZZZ
MNCWKFLDIEATLDKKLIKRAYSKLLRVFHPEKDAKGFQQLRQAYKTAISLANKLSSDEVNRHNEEQETSNIISNNAEPLSDILNIAIENEANDITRYYAEATVNDQDLSIDHKSSFYLCEELLRLLSEKFDERLTMSNWEKFTKLFESLGFDDKQLVMEQLIIELTNAPFLPLSIYQQIDTCCQMADFISDIVSFNQLNLKVSNIDLKNLLAYLQGNKLAVRTVNYTAIFGAGLSVDSANEIIYFLEKTSTPNTKDFVSKDTDSQDKELIDPASIDIASINMETLDKLIKKHPEFFFLKIKQLYCLYQKEGYSESCLEVLQNLNENKNEIFSLELLIFKGDFEYKKNNFEEASLFFSQALSFDPSSIELTYKLIKSHIKLSNFEIARNMLHGLVEQTPKNTLFQIEYKYCSYNILKTKNFDMDNLEDLELKIELLFELNQHEDVLSIAEQYLNVIEDIRLKKTICFYKAKIAKNKKQGQAAFDAIKKSLAYAAQLNENGYDELLEMLEILNSNVDIETGDAFFQEKMLLQALQLFPKQTTVLYLLGEFYLNIQRNFSVAVSYYSQAIAVNPSFHQCYKGRAYAYSKLREYDKSLLDCETYLKQEYGYLPLLSLTARLQHELGQYENAIEAYSHLFSFYLFKDISADQRYFFSSACFKFLEERYQLKCLGVIAGLPDAPLSSKHMQLLQNCVSHMLILTEEYDTSTQRESYYTLEIYTQLAIALFKLNRVHECKLVVSNGLKHIDEIIQAEGSQNRDVDYYTRELNYTLAEAYFSENDFEIANEFHEKTLGYYEKYQAPHDFMFSMLWFRYSQTSIRHYNNKIDLHHFGKMAITYLSELSRNPISSTNVAYYCAEKTSQIYNIFAENPLENDCVETYRQKALQYAQQDRSPVDKT